LVVAVVLLATSAVASATPVTFVGSISCSVTGTMKFSPALVNGGSATETVTVTAALSGCSGNVTQFSKTITKGTMKVSGVGTGNDCASYLTEGKVLPALNGSVKWSPNGIVATTVHYSGASIAADFNADAVSVALPDALGTATATAGSFAGPISPLSAAATATADVVFKKCQTRTGVSSLVFSGGPITIG
jgi:hypothetical protein